MKRRYPMGYAGFAIFILGIIFVIVAPINKRKNKRCSAQTQGVLTGSYRRGSSRDSAGRTYVYSYSVDGIEYQIKSPNISSEVGKVGDSCTIWYNPANPKQAQPFHYDSLKIYNIILILGFVMIVAGFVLMAVGIGR